MMLTERQAFNAMVEFLKSYLAQTRYEEIGLLLSGLRINSSGGTSDPAYWFDWMDAVAKATITDRDGGMP